MVFSNDKRSETRLNRALNHVNNLWFPFNPTVISQLEEGFKDEAFSDDPDQLLTILKQDFALFTYVIKELMHIATSEQIDPVTICNPLKLIRWGGPTRIKQIVVLNKKLPSTHALSLSENFQTDRLRETAIIASTAEVLSENANLDPDMGFCRGVMREIGLNLIAWNYPLLYARIIKAIPSDSSLDDELTKELGFSPMLLAMRIMQPTNVKVSLADITIFEQEWQVYDKLCAVGEALAHASNPNTYPSAEHDWSIAQEYIIRNIGADGLEQINKKSADNSTSYTQALPSTFEDLKNLDPQAKILSHTNAIRACNNSYVRQCLPEIQDALRALYSEMPINSVNSTALEHLIKDLIPKAGFTGGCVFIVDPSTLTLSPRTIIGQVGGRKINKIILRSTATNVLVLDSSVEDLLAAAIGHEDVIANAFACEQPIIIREQGNLSDKQGYFEDKLTTICSSLGRKRRIGVLYLEKPESTDDSRTIGTFKALRQALCDALLLE